MSATYQNHNNRNSKYKRNSNYNRNSNSNRRSQRNSNFVEDRNAAFFLGKLNKNHNREHIYNQLIRLTQMPDFNFYITKFDMPNGPNGQGNQGFAFVHTKSPEQARRIIAMKHLRLGNQECEVKSYSGRTEVESTSGRETPDSGVRACYNYNKPNHVNNPLKTANDNWSSDQSRSRVNSGFSRFSDAEATSGKNSESDSHGSYASKQNHSEFNNENGNSVNNSDSINIHMQKDYEEDAHVQNNYEPFVNSTNPVNSMNSVQNQIHPADSEMHDQWITDNTNFILSQVESNSLDWVRFKRICNEFTKMLVNFDARKVEEVERLMNGQSIHQTILA